ncbi:MAG: M3 family metallopeptidase [Alphaproteobacteria bacterium]
MDKTFKVHGNGSSGNLPTWDLSVAFYSDLKDPQIEEDKKALKKLAKEISLYRDEIIDLEPYELSILLRKYETMIELARKLSYFAHLYSDTHKTDEEVSQFKSKIREEISRVFENLGFIHFELNALPHWKMYEFVNHPKLHRWLPWLMSLFSGYWSLTEGVSFIINKKSLVSSSWDRLYDETCAELKFHLNGKTLNEAEIEKKIHSNDSKTRQRALAEMNKVYRDHSHLFTMCYNMILKDKSVDDELYGMSEPVTDSLFENNISKEDLLAMVNEVTDSYIPISQRFYKLMAQMMKVDHIGYADRCYNPVEIAEKKLSWPDCITNVLTAYAGFSPTYLAYAAQIINTNIIDVPPRKGKVSGAYCIRGQVPYILLNFTGSNSDVRTFAHELGHAVHHILAAEVGILNDTTPSALAEVASEFAENLVFKQQMSEAKTDREKLSLLIGRVQDMVNSIQRQVAFYKFEERTHRERKKGELSTERLNQIWREENSRCLGFDIGKEAECMWMGISHIFGMPYYVYSYAFAGLVVNNLIKAYDKWDENREFQIQEDFDDLYIDMLSNTGVEDFKSLLEPFGIDAKSPDFWSNGLSLITDYIDEIEKLAKSEGLL